MCSFSSTTQPLDQAKHINGPLLNPFFIMSIIACLFYILSEIKGSSISKDLEINNKYISMM